MRVRVEYWLKREHAGLHETGEQYEQRVNALCARMSEVGVTFTSGVYAALMTAMVRNANIDDTYNALSADVLTLSLSLSISLFSLLSVYVCARVVILLTV